MAFKPYSEIDWEDVKKALENYSAIQALQQLCFIHGENTETMKEGCRASIVELIEED